MFFVGRAGDGKGLRAESVGHGVHFRREHAVADGQVSRIGDSTSRSGQRDLSATARQSHQNRTHRRTCRRTARGCTFKQLCFLSGNSMYLWKIRFFLKHGFHSAQRMRNVRNATDVTQQMQLAQRPLYSCVLAVASAAFAAFITCFLRSLRLLEIFKRSLRTQATLRCMKPTLETTDFYISMVSQLGLVLRIDFWEQCQNRTSILSLKQACNTLTECVYFWNAR